ncbi:MAG: hypothetical protein ACOCX1_06100 [Fimbriimonadaceae bacterium]
MRKFLLCLIVASLAVPAFAETLRQSYEISGAGGMTGSAELEVEYQESGNKIVRLDMRMSRPGTPAVSVRQESTYAPDGRPVRMLQTIGSDAAAQKRTVQATFESRGAVVVASDGGSRVERIVAYPGTQSILAKHEFWFPGEAPEPGTEEMHYRFDLTQLRWTMTKVTYEGPNDEGHHRLKQGDSVILLDDQGLPVRFELGQLVLERTE